MCSQKLIGQLFVLFLSTQANNTTKDDKKLLRIVGGQSVSYGKYPYIARLELKHVIGVDLYRAHICTCSVLTPIWTLTASHCSLILDNIPNATLMVRYGSTYPFDDKGNYSVVIKFVRHPSYRLLGEPNKMYSLDNDIALLKTQPVMLPVYGRVSSVDHLSLTGFTAVVAGFGITNYTSGKMMFSDTLKLNMPLQTLNVLIKRCSNDVLDYVKISPGICLARRCRESVSICSGDSGGPLIHNSRIIGVNSMGADLDCTNKIEDRFKSNFVGIITAASPFSEWIGKVINED